MTAPAKAAPMREDVTQADWEALALLLGMRQLDPQWVSVIGTGGWDKTSEMRVIVRHRLAHTARPDAGDTRECTCHPDDQPPGACRRKFASTECQSAAGDEDVERVAELVARLREIKRGDGHLYPVEKARRVIPYGNMINEAADMIERLAAMREGADRGMVEQLREALVKTKQAVRYVAVGDGYFDPYANHIEAVDAIVAAALSPEQPR